MSEQTFKDAYASLNRAQKQAVDHIDGPVLVIAGPGTGKTQLLSIRIANILRKTDTLADNILCLTFTESAAQTMRERLVNIIGRDAYGITISTYHAFGRELLSRYPDYFGLYAELEPADDLMIDTIIREVIDALPYSNPLKQHRFVSDIKSVISDCKRALLTPDDLRTIASDNETCIRALSAAITEQTPKLNRISAQCVPILESFLNVAAGYRTKPVKNIPSLANRFYDALEEAIEEAETSGKTKPLSAWKKDWLSRDVNGQFIMSGQETTAKLIAIATVYEAYNERLSAHKRYDYDDMILQAIEGLEQHPELRYNLQERYLYLLLDEFQDTNDAQFRLVELLTDNPVAEGNPNVLAVGDDDQAIYAFQGANYSHMLRFTERYQDVMTVTLTENYRSTADILHISEAIAEQITTRLTKQLPGVSKHLTAMKPAAADAVITRREFKTPLGQNAWVATHIRKLIDAGIPAHEIAVLSPLHVHLEQLVPHLQSNGIPIVYEKRDDVLADPAIAELITMSRLVRALADEPPGADNYWPEVLSYSFWQLPTSEIWQLSWQARDTKISWTEAILASPTFRAIGLFFIRLSQLFHTLPMEQMLDYLMGTAALALYEPDLEAFISPYADAHINPVKTNTQINQLHWHILSNLTVLRAQLRDYLEQSTITPTLADFIGFIDAHMAADIKILNTNPYQDSLDAVTLLTAYGAKGREFHVVIILATIDDVWGNKKRDRSNAIALPPNVSVVRYQGKDSDERLRLFYVALTRAKAQLHMVSYTNTFSGSLTTRLQWLDEHENEEGMSVSPLLPPSSQHIEQNTLEEKPTLEVLTLNWQQYHHHAREAVAIKELLAPRLSAYRLSATELNTFLDVSRGGPQKFFLRSILKFPSATSVSGEYGSAIHESLEWIQSQYKKTQHLPTLEQLDNDFVPRLEKRQIAEEEKKLLIARGKRTLHHFLTHRVGDIQKSGVNEYNFAHENIMLDDVRLTGKVDRLEINEAEKTIRIIDYKTGRGATRWDTSTRLRHYKMQLYFYRLLVTHSHKFQHYSVTDGLLDFVEPNDKGETAQLALNFKEEEGAYLETLIHAVWERIMNLEFPDTEQYVAQSSGQLAFEQWLLR